jgi:hypothetical protein
MYFEIFKRGSYGERGREEGIVFIMTIFTIELFGN